MTGKTLTGRETITYVNTTDVPIPDLVFHLYLNAFRDENTIFLREGGVRHRGYTWSADAPGWIEVTAIRLADGTPLTLRPLEDGTLAHAELPAPIAPGAAAQVEVEFRAQLPRIFARTGYAGDFFFVGQWFPKLGVWQDGAWNAYPFHANAEFYADFGDYDVTVTLPEGYVTGGTGMPVSTSPNGDGTQTLRYQAGHVIDFAWTASPHFRQASRQVGAVEVLYLYLPEHDWTVERVLDAAEAAVRYYSEWYGSYPYPRLTLVDVPDEGEGAGGMEYPTLVTIGAMSIFGLGPGRPLGAGDRSLEMVAVHEIGHQWWQSMVAFNEAEEPWLDEGFTDYSALRVMDALYGRESSILESGDLRAGYLDSRRMEYLLSPRIPMYGQPWKFEMWEYGIAAYAKPVLALSTLEGVLGEETMLRVMRTFFERYQFAHPTTEDFRRTAEEVSGRDLTWFFDGLVYGGEVVNYTVTAVEERRVTVQRQGELAVPAEVLITFADGGAVWETLDGTQAEVTFTYPDRPPVRRAEVDPERKITLDLRWADNGLSRQPETAAWLALVVRMVYSIQSMMLGMGGL